MFAGILTGYHYSWWDQKLMCPIHTSGEHRVHETWSMVVKVILEAQKFWPTWHISQQFQPQQACTSVVEWYPVRSNTWYTGYVIVRACMCSVCVCICMYVRRTRTMSMRMLHEQQNTSTQGSFFTFLTALVLFQIKLNHSLVPAKLWLITMVTK